MLKGLTKHEGKEHGKTLKHEAPRSINQKATQNKNNTGTTALECFIVFRITSSKIVNFPKRKDEFPQAPGFGANVIFIFVMYFGVNTKRIDETRGQRARKDFKT